MRSIKDFLSSPNLITLISILIIVVLLLMILTFQNFDEKLFNNQNLYYYTFSTIVQGFLALIAFMGMVVIYKLQIIESELIKTSDKIKPHLEYFSGASVQTISWEEAMSLAKKHLDDTNLNKEPNSSRLKFLNLYWDAMSKLNNQQKFIKAKMMDFSFITFFNIGISLFALPLSRLIINKQAYAMGELFILGSIGLGCLSMFYCFKLLKLCLGYSQSYRIGMSKIK